MKTGIYKVQSKAEPDKFLIIHHNEIKVIMDNLNQLLSKGQYPGERLQDHFNKYGLDDLECSLITACNNFMATEYMRDLIKEMNPYFNGSDAMIIIDAVEFAVVPEPKTKKAVIKSPRKKPVKSKSKK
jgi:hypothetical protein